MRYRVLSAFVACLAATGAASAFPGRIPTSEKVVAAGHTLKVGSMSVLDPTCRSLGPLSVSLIESPHNGRVEVQQGRDYPSYSTLNTRSRCNLHMVPATQIFYTPAPGYTGEDSFAVEFVGPLGNVGRRQFEISVR